MHTPTTHGSRADKVPRARKSLDAHLKELAEQMSRGKSEQLVSYLEFSAQFHAYSFGNMMLILLQCPNATRVAGLRQLNRLGRYVRAGEKGIMILAPMSVRKRVKEEKGEPASEKPGNAPPEECTEGGAELITIFKPVYVFDVSATDGEPLPTLLHSVEVAGGAASTCYPGLENAVRAAGITLEVVEFIPGAPTAVLFRRVSHELTGIPDMLR